MPMTMLFAVHLTLMLFGRRREHTRTANHVPVPQEDQAPASQDDHAPAPQDDHAPAPQQDRAPATQEDWVSAEQDDWDLAALEEDWDSAAEEDRNSAPPPERVVPTRIPAILENTDPLLVAPKAMLPNALPRTGATPRITPTFVTTGPNGQTKINPF